MNTRATGLLLLALCGAWSALAQQPPASQGPRTGRPPAPSQPAPGTPETPVSPSPQTTAPAQGVQPSAQAPAASTSRIVYGGLNLQNASLSEVIDMLARQLKINYVLDARIKGGVILNTYGETKNIDTRALLNMVLRINGMSMVQEGEIYRIVPLAEINRAALEPEQLLAKDIAPDDQEMLNLVFLKYTTAEELANVLKNFVGRDAQIISYAPANLLMLLDSHRNMRRTMELVALFDNDALANQRVRTFEVTNARPTSISKELEEIFRAIALNGKNSPIRFLPIDRLNTVIAVAPNPGAFGEVEKWIRKLDVPPKATAGDADNYVYRVKYGDAQCIAQAITSLYSGYPILGGCNNQGSGLAGGFGASALNGAGYGAGYGGGGYGGAAGYGGAGYGGAGNSGAGYGGAGYGGAGYGAAAQGYGAGTTYRPAGIGTAEAASAASGVQPAGTQGGPGTGQDLTGTYLGYASANGQLRIPHVIANPFANTLLIQATPQEYVGIVKLLRDLDVPPRQVLIQARIYEVDLTGDFASGVSAYLQKVGAKPTATTTSSSTSSTTGGVSGLSGIFGSAGTATGSTSSTSTNAGVASIPHQFLGSLSGASSIFTAGTMVGMSRELLAAVNLQVDHQKAKVLSAPSIIATDSIPASINVGEEVPTLTAQAVTGVQQGGNSLFANQINNVSSGVTLAVVARVNSSGIVTLIINQEVSAPVAPAAGGIQSPSFNQRSVHTQVTVQDGDTVAIGGIIDESTTVSQSGIPGLYRIPIIGALFGSRSYSKQRTELVVFLTPRVIYDTNQITDATEELKSGFHTLQKSIRDE